MKNFAVIVLLLIVAVAGTVLYLFQPSFAPAESMLIAMERSKFVKSQDVTRINSDPVYACAVRLKLENLDYLLAKAYIAENMPDDAVAVLEKLISSEEVRNDGSTRRRSRSCANEARYYKALREAYALKQDDARAESADKQRDELITIAYTAKKREQLEEGKSLRLVFGD
jgi:hypothetical protein